LNQPIPCRTLHESATDTFRLRIFNNGTGVFEQSQLALALDAVQGRFALRFMYEGRLAQEPQSKLLVALAETLRTDHCCERADCGKPISPSRQINALRYIGRAKWCSKRCERTEASRRFSARHRRTYEADPTKLCERADCSRPISAKRQINGLICRTPVRWCSRACGDIVAYRRHRAKA
jgi:hypothetical protein